MSYSVTLCADTAIDLARQVWDLNAQLNPGEVSAPEATAPATTGARSRTRRATVDTTPRPGPAQEAPSAGPAAEGPAGEGAVGQSEGDAAQPEPEGDAADQVVGEAAEGDAGNAGDGAAGDTAAGGAEVPTRETCNEFGRQLAERVNFSAVQEVFAQFQIKKFGELAPEKYADFCAEVRRRLEAQAAKAA